MGNTIFKKDATAQGVAKQRYIESLAEPDRRVVYDPYAEHFVFGSGLIKLLGHKLSVWLTRKFARGFHEHLIARTRFIDDVVNQSAAENIEQYVILGAGYDSRAYRLGLPSKIKVFEVDQADVQLQKRAKLPKHLQSANYVKYVSVDFDSQLLSERLLNAGFEPNKPTLFTLEGVSQYISKPALSATLNELKILTGDSRTVFCFSYVDEQLLDNPSECFGVGYPNAAKRADNIMKLSAKFGEPWQSLYSAQEIESLLNESDFQLKQHTSLDDLNTLYFTPKGREVPQSEIMKLEHFVVATSP